MEVDDSWAVITVSLKKKKEKNNWGSSAMSKVIKCSKRV